MRFSVSYKLNKLGQAYRMQVYSLIKQAIRTSNSRYYEELFVNSKNKIKPFSFSVYLHNYSLENETILLEQITVTISSPNMEFSVHAFNGLRKIKEYKIGDEVWVQSNIQLLQESTISTRKSVFRTLSPILVEDKNGKPLTPVDHEYERELNYYANLQIQQFAERSLYEELSFTPIDLRKKVIKEKNRHLNNTSYLYFTTYSGTFTLEGNPNDLQLLYQLGLGKRTTYFGLLDYEGEGV